MLRKLFASRRRCSIQRPFRKLMLEALEDRTLLSSGVTISLGLSTNTIAPLGQPHTYSNSQNLGDYFNSSTPISINGSVSSTGSDGPASASASITGSATASQTGSLFSGSISLASTNSAQRVTSTNTGGGFAEGTFSSNWVAIFITAGSLTLTYNTSESQQGNGTFASGGGFTVLALNSTPTPVNGSGTATFQLEPVLGGMEYRIEIDVNAAALNLSPPSFQSSVSDQDNFQWTFTPETATPPPSQPNPQPSPAPISAAQPPPQDLTDRGVLQAINQSGPQLEALLGTAINAGQQVGDPAGDSLFYVNNPSNPTYQIPVLENLLAAQNSDEANALYSDFATWMYWAWQGIATVELDNANGVGIDPELASSLITNIQYYAQQLQQNPLAGTPLGMSLMANEAAVLGADFDVEPLISLLDGLTSGEPQTFSLQPVLPV